MQVIDAVLSSKLPPDLRHMLMVMAHRADSSNGRGLSSQGTIGQLMGCSEREVRRKLDRLEAIADSPVRVTRRYRQRRDGRGRTSDEYVLVLVTNRTPVSGENAGPTGRGLPVGDTSPAADQPDVCDGPTGRIASDQQDTDVRGSAQGSAQKDPHSVVARKLTTPKSRPKAKGKSKAQAKHDRTPEQKQAHQEITAWYFTEFERLRGVKPTWAGAEATLVYTLLERLKFDAAMASQRVTNGLEAFPGTATIREIARNPDKYAVAPPAPRGAQRPVQGGDISGVLARARGKGQGDHGQTGFEALRDSRLVGMPRAGEQLERQMARIREMEGAK